MGIVVLYYFVAIIFSQEYLDSLVYDVLAGKNDSALVYIQQIEQRYPNNPKMLFLKGLLEEDGESTKNIFVNLYNNHPTSIYSDDAVMKVAEYYYSAGLYMQSADWLKKMPLYYSRSPHIERAIKLFLNSLVISGHADTALFYSKVFKRQFPLMDVESKVAILIEKIGLENENKIDIHNKNIINNKVEVIEEYSLQIGAYSQNKNAQNQKDILLEKGYDARITKLFKQNKILFAVRIGYFENKEDAQEAALKIKSNIGFNTIIVINE